MKKKSIIFILVGVFVGLIVLVISLLSEDGDGIAGLFDGGGADGVADDAVTGVTDGVAVGTVADVTNQVADDNISFGINHAANVSDALLFSGSVSNNRNNSKDKETSRFGRLKSMFAR